MENKNSRVLIKKYLQETATPEEKALLESWYITTAENQEEETREPDYPKIEIEILQALRKEQLELPRKLWPRIAAAASIILCLSIGGYLLLHKQPSQRITQSQIHDIPPGSNKAILTLANGRKIVLTDAKNSKVAEEENTTIIKKNNGEVAYTKNSAAVRAVLAYNTLTTPRGGKFELTLSDGTQVTLNAASSIRYPVNFVGNERRVEITGEAYFEVAHNRAKPFFVSAKGQTVQVLGTHFNINAYDDEPSIKTTLLEGSIKISEPGQSALLKPGQQAQIGITGTIKVIDGVDIEEAIAWKNGMFKFNHADIKTVMRQLSRWYDVDVEYEGKMSEREFSGKLFRNVNASQVLDILSFSKVHFRIENTANNKSDKKIIVTQ